MNNNDRKYSSFEEEIDLKQLIRIFIDNKKFVLGFTIIFGIVAIWYYAFSIQPVYSSSASFILPKDDTIIHKELNYNFNKLEISRYENFLHISATSELEEKSEKLINKAIDYVLEKNINVQSNKDFLSSEISRLNSLDKNFSSSAEIEKLITELSLELSKVQTYKLSDELITKTHMPNNTVLKIISASIASLFLAIFLVSIKIIILSRFNGKT